ncbi:hypothetical protein SDC9_59088 [bioreactor metagenome]|uniref:Methyl-accepting chemotaxis protein n=1 Tax=bioreactor metagenome TaxID=1076179 RepID=A0A644XF04_9ZZZZ
MKRNSNKVKVTLGKTSIASKITLTLFVLCFLALLATGVVIGMTVNDYFTNSEKDILNETTKSVSNEANAFFERYIAIVEQMAQDKNLQNFMLNAEGRDTLLETEGFMIAGQTVDETQKANPDVILSAYVAEGDFYLVSPTVYSKEEYDVSSKDYYKAVTEKKVNITDPYLDAITGGIVITISAPVTVNNEVIGLTAVDIAIDKLTAMVGNYKLGETGNFTLLTENNIIAGHKDEDSLLKSIKDIDISENMIQSVNSRTGEVTEFTYNGETYIGNSVEIGNTGWQILSSLPKDEFTSHTQKIIMSIVIIFAVMIIALLAVMTVMIKKMTKPIKKITDITDKLAAGELDAEINIKSNDEIGELAQSIGSLTARLKSYIAYIAESEYVLNEMARGNLNVELKNDYDGEFAKLKVSLLSLSDTLKETIGKIKESSESINMNAEQVSSGAQVLAQGTTEQASAIEELSAEINEIYHTIVNNAEHAVSAGNKAKETASEVERGNVQMSEMLSAMDEISKTSREINKIIKVIDDIAFQTNILALNAAVEAARAGSAGKGFAVVADEVRNLAGKSAEAAKQTTALIENSINAINKGTALADEAGKSLSGIVNKTNETNELIAEIASASSHQTVSVNQIKSGIEQISSVVQENAASAEASAANSEELSGQSHILNELVSKFNL